MIIQIVREETRCSQFMGYSLRLAARVILYTLSHRQDSTYHSLWYTGWNDRSTMKDRSDHPSLHKWTLYHGVTSHSTLLFPFNDLKVPSVSVPYLKQYMNIPDSCPRQRNRRRSVPVPVTGVRYNSLLCICNMSDAI